MTAATMAQRTISRRAMIMGAGAVTAWAASVQAQAPGAAGRDFMIVVLLAVVVYGLGKLALWAFQRSRQRP